MSLAQRIEDILRPTVNGLGYELLCLEYISGGKDPLLRLYIDHAEGIVVDDCAKVSRAVSDQLEIEDPVASAYRLEVSSPGWDRPLVTVAHFEQFKGSEAKLRLLVPQDGRRNFRGRIVSAEGEAVQLDVDGSEISIAVADIERARLVPDATE